MQLKPLRLGPPRFVTRVAVPLITVLAWCASIPAYGAKPAAANASVEYAPAAEGRAAFPLARQGTTTRVDTGRRSAPVAADPEDCDEEDEEPIVQSQPMSRSQAARYAAAEPASRAPAPAYPQSNERRSAASAGMQQPARSVTTSVPVYRPKNLQTWEIVPSDKTLNAALARWARTAGWQLVWELPVDYSVQAGTAIQGTFEEAVGLVAQSMGSAEVPMKVIFYAGNRVLRIVAKGAE